VVVQQEEKQQDWLVGGASVKGANHERSGKANQDAWQWSRQGNHLVLAVSDGHGGSSHFRSQTGARLAVETAVDVILEEADVKQLTSDVVGLEENIQDKLPQRIVSEWKTRVDEDYKERSFTKEELETLEEKQGQEASKKLKENHYRAYGATLLAVLLTEEFALYLQLGDGSLVAVTEEQEVDRIFPVGEGQLGNETHSLCMENCEAYFKLQLTDLAAEGPKLLLATTDGYENSFRREADFFQVARDLQQLIEEEGVSYVKERLESWLYQTSCQGSGDDITAGFIYLKSYTCG
jgi:hypothetical protein